MFRTHCKHKNENVCPNISERDNQNLQNALIKFVKSHQIEFKQITQDDTKIIILP